MSNLKYVSKDDEKIPYLWNQYTLSYKDKDDNTIAVYAGITRSSKESRLNSEKYRAIDGLATLFDWSGPYVDEWKNSEVEELMKEAEVTEDKRTENLFDEYKNKSILVTGGRWAEKGDVQYGNKKYKMSEFLYEFNPIGYKKAMVKALNDFKNEMNPNSGYYKELNPYITKLLENADEFSPDFFKSVVKDFWNRYNINLYNEMGITKTKIMEWNKQRKYPPKEISYFWTQYWFKKLYYLLFTFIQNYNK